MNIIVLAGGLSPERNVSLSSGSLISSALRRKGHNVLMVDVYEGVKELPEDPLTLFSSDISAGKTVGSSAPSANDLEMIRKANGNRREMIGPNVIELCKMADARCFYCIIVLLPVTPFLWKAIKQSERRGTEPP